MSASWGVATRLVHLTSGYCVREKANPGTLLLTSCAANGTARSPRAHPAAWGHSAQPFWEPVVVSSTRCLNMCATFLGTVLLFKAPSWTLRIYIYTPGSDYPIDFDTIRIYGVVQ
jgi:hypothetical protein